MMRSSSGKMVGLSVTELISVSNTEDTYLIASFVAPCTCGTQRKEYGSCTCLPGTGDEFAAFQQFADVLARFDLSFVGTDLLDTIHERVDATVKGFQGKGGYQIGFLGEAEGFKDGKDTVGAHELRTVQQSKAFLAHQFDGLPAEFVEYADCLALPAFIVHVTHTDKRQEKIGKAEQGRPMLPRSRGRRQ